ncbi:MAG: hypothetical protein ACREHD_06010 [Pirellulales bacterium]
MNFATTVLAFASLVLLAGAKPKTADERVTLENLVTAKPLPEGYASSASEMKEGDKLEGNMIIIQKEGSTSKVVITIELESYTIGQRSSRQQRVTSTA